MNDRHFSLLYLICALAAVLMAGGCLEMSQEIRLKEDGAAEFSLHYSIPLVWLETVGDGHDLIRGWQTGEAPPPAGQRKWMFNQAAVREYFSQNGLTMMDFQLWTDTATGRRHARVQFAADNLQRSLPGGRMGDFSLTRNEDGEMVFRANFAFVSAPTATPVEMPQAEADFWRELLQGLVVELKVVAPTPILETTGELIDQQTAHWRFEPATDLELLRLPPVIELRFQDSPGREQGIMGR